MYREKMNIDNGEVMVVVISQLEFEEYAKDIVSNLTLGATQFVALDTLRKLYAKLFYDKTLDEITDIIQDRNNVIYDNKTGIIYGTLGEETNLVLNGEKLYVGDLVGYFEKPVKKKSKKKIERKCDISIVCKDEDTNQYFVFGSKAKCIAHTGDLNDLLDTHTLEKIKSYEEVDNETKIYDTRISVKKEEK